MKLIHGTLRPGRVLEVLEGGDIKVEAPGLFTAEDKDNLPPVMPFFGGHANTYSAPKVNDEVWVLSYSDNPRSLHWLRKDDGKTVNKDLITGENVEILCNRANGAGWATIMFESGKGWIIKNDNSVINIRKDGSILLNPNMPNRTIDLCSNSISLGSEGGSKHPAALGDEVQACLEIIQTALETIKQTASMNAYTAPIGIALGGMPAQLKKQAAKTVSSNVTLD